MSNDERREAVRKILAEFREKAPNALATMWTEQELHFADRIIAMLEPIAKYDHPVGPAQESAE